MPSLLKRWLVHPPIPYETQQELSAFHPILRQVLYNRGYSTREAAERFVNAIPPPGTHPLVLLGMSQALDRIRWAIHKHEPIAIYGDYDADGVTATALLTIAMRCLGADVRGYIPNRFDEGYGLNKEALDSLFQSGVRLVITVDCGIRSPVEANHARKLGLDLIITDHHHPGPEMPLANAIINPKQPGDDYPDKDLAGVGLAYKLVCGLYGEPSPGSYSDLPPSSEFLDLVAIGTVADMAPLIGENRSLVKAGLTCLRQPQRQGVMSLIGVSGLKPHSLNATDISFVLGPRLNAAGRLDSALAALNLLMTQEPQEAGFLAQQLDNQNRERQQVMRQIQAHAEHTALAADPDTLFLFAADSNYNPGVVGLAASRLVEQYYRPAAVVQRGDEYSRGSCRSIPEFHITDALDECSDLLFHHGGHAAAAGFTVKTERLPELIERLKEIARRKLGSLDLRPTLHADAEVSFSELQMNLMNELDLMEPTGLGNPQAALLTRNAYVKSSRVVGKDGTHLKLVLEENSITFDAIGFRLGHWQNQMPTRIDLLYTFEVNEYNGRRAFQLNLRDIKPANSG